MWKAVWVTATDNAQTEVPPVRYSPYPHVWRASSEVELRKVQFCCGVGMVPESGTFRSAQSHLFSLTSLEEGRAEVSSATQWGEFSVGPWRNQCWLREVQGQQGLLYWNLATNWAGPSIVPHPAWQGKQLSHLVSQVTTGLMWLSGNLEKKNCLPLSETTSSDSSC